MKLRVASSVIAPVLSSIFCMQPPTKISGVLNTIEFRNTSMVRRWYCTRPPPSGPGDADWIATGFPPNGWSLMRDTQSIAFFRAPGSE